MKGKAPAFQLYPKDFDGDEKVRVMDCEQEGAYFRLLKSHWLEGDVPADVTELAIIARMPLARFRAVVWPRVSRCFRAEVDGETAPDGRLWNPRMRRDLLKDAAFRAERAGAGKKGASAKWGMAEPRKGNGSAIKNHMANDGSPSPSPSASATNDGDGGARAGATTVADVLADAPFAAEPTDVRLERTVDAATCPACRRVGTLRQSRDGGFFCGRRVGGCGTSFRLDDAEILAQVEPRIADSLRRRAAPTTPTPRAAGRTRDEDVIADLSAWARGEGGGDRG